MFVKHNNQAITLQPHSTSGQRLLGGRAYLETLNGHTDEVDIHSVAGKLRKLRDSVSKQFVGRQDLAEATALAFASGEHLFAYGPPGTAKSSVLRLFAEGVGGKFWRIVLNPDTSREDIVGALDPVALTNGEWRRKWASFATADVAFLDEVWKSSPQVANMLLDGLEERRVTAGDEERTIPLLSAVAASNEIPEQEEVQAAYDRFLLRVNVGYIRDKRNFRKLFKANAGSQAVTEQITPDEIRLLAATAEVLSFDPPTDMVEVISDMWKQLGKDGHTVSDRRWRKMMKVACAQALLEGEEPSCEHLAVGRYILWADAEDEEEIGKKVTALCDPYTDKMYDLEEVFADIMVRYNQIQDGSVQQEKAITQKTDLITHLMKLADMAKGLSGNLPAKHQKRLNELSVQVNEIRDNILSLKIQVGVATF